METPEKLPVEFYLDTVINNAGLAFAMGLVGSFPFQYLKGLLASPNGSRLAGACRAARLNAPRVGGKFAAWSALLGAAAFGLDLAGLKNDNWMLIASPAVATGLVAVPRRGLGGSARIAGIVGGTFALAAVSSIMLERSDASPMRKLESEEERAAREQVKQRVDHYMKLLGLR